MKVKLISPNQYRDGMTDGMKLYRIENRHEYVFAANVKDAKMRAKAGLTCNYQAAKEFVNNSL